MSVVIWTVALIVGSAFFVAVEFSLMAAKAYRLEEAAETSAPARAALRNASELTLLLAGAQLGITVCTLALGAITKPAVHHALMPLLEQVGVPVAAADVAAFVLALLVVTFLHLVIGEMAPKSWAIAHPEQSAIWLALPMRAYMTVMRPLLRALNAAANWMVRRAGAEPVDELSARQDAAGLRHLVEHSANVGALDASYRAPLEAALQMGELTLDDVMSNGPLTEVAPGATVAEVQERTRATRHRRVLVRDGDRTVGVVHVRDTLNLDPADSVEPYYRTPVRLASTTRLAAALASMKDSRTHLVVVTRDGQEAGVVSMEDILPRLLPQGL